MPMPKNNEFTLYRNDQIASKLFKGALADSLAKFQQEIQTHYDTSLECYRDVGPMQLHLASADANLDDSKKERSSDFLCKAHCSIAEGDMKLALPHNFLPVSGIACEASLKETGSNSIGHHPSQLVTSLAVLPPEPPSPHALDDHFPCEEKPASLDSDNDYSANDECDASETSNYRTIGLWEHIVNMYMHSEEDELVGSHADAWDLWELQPCWLRPRRRRKVHKVFSKQELTRSGSSRYSVKTSRQTRAGDKILSASWLQNMIVEPNSGKRIAWVCIGATLLMYDLIMIPLGAIAGQGSVVLQAISWVTFAYWLLDLPLNFIVGFLENGIVEMRPREVALRYLRSWLAFDASIVTFDLGFLCLEAFLDESMGVAGAVTSARTARMGRLFRVVRGVRLLRLVKLGQLFTFVTDIIHTEYWVLCLKLCAHLCFILGANHYVACGWFSLGQEIYHGTFGRDMPSWIVEAEIENAAGYIQYLMSLHWSVTQFTPATNNINPACALERAYAILIVLVALVTFSSFISSVTNTVTELRRINVERNNEMGRLREFISKRQISQDLTMRLWHVFRHNFQKRRCAVLESDIKFFREVPDSVMVELHEEIYMPVFRAHRAFSLLRNLDRALISQICHTCYSDWFAIPNKDIFLRYGDCTQVLFVAMGRLFYKRPPDSTVADLHLVDDSGKMRALGSMASTRASTGRDSTTRTSTGRSSTDSMDVPRWRMETEVIHISKLRRRSVAGPMAIFPSRKSVAWSAQCEEGVWVSEPALWIKWKHWGHLATDSHVEMIVLDCFKLHERVANHGGPLWQALKKVAIFFVEYAETELCGGRAVTDVSVSQDTMYGLAQRSLLFQDRERSMRSVTGLLSERLSGVT